MGGITHTLPYLLKLLGKMERVDGEGVASGEGDPQELLQELPEQISGELAGEVPEPMRARKAALGRR